jgi:hypothetical protein
LTALDAENALDLDAGVEAAYDELLPSAGELGGGASGFFVVGPVDTVLARLARRLGRSAEAREHADVAIALATKVGNPRWVAAAEAERAAVLAIN